MSMVFSWNAKRPEDKAFIADQKKNINKEVREQRISSGLPVSVNKNKAAPTKGGDIIRDTLNPLATLLVRPGQALAAIKGFTPEEQTVKSNFFGDIKASQSSKDVIKDVGRGVESVALGFGLSSIPAAAGKSTVIQAAKTLGIEGAISGFGQSAGRAITEDKKGWSAALDILTGTVAGGVSGAVLGGVGNKLFGKSAAKIASEVEERANLRAFSTKTRPEVPAAGVKPPEAPIQDFIYEPIKETVQKSKLKTIPFDETPVTTKAPTQQSEQISSTTRPQESIPAQNTIPDERVNSLKSVVGDVSDGDVVTFKGAINRFDELINSDPSYVKKIAMGDIDGEGQLKKFWALKLLEKHADEIGDVKLSQELSLSTVGREAGRELVGGKITGIETTSDIIRAARKKRAETLNIPENKLIREERDIFDNLKKDISKTPKTPEASDSAINSIIC